MQCAAVRTQFLAIKEPPQLWPFPYPNETWKGYLSMLVSCPPTILPSNLFHDSGTLAPIKLYCIHCNEVYMNFISNLPKVQTTRAKTTARRNILNDL